MTQPATRKRRGLRGEGDCCRPGEARHELVADRIRVEPPCYVVLLFSSDGNYELRETLPLAELDRLQVHRIYDDQFPLQEVWQPRRRT